jgi:hypothetical protein
MEPTNRSNQPWDQLKADADAGLRGQGAVVEAMRRLADKCGDRARRRPTPRASGNRKRVLGRGPRHLAISTRFFWRR